MKEEKKEKPKKNPIRKAIIEIVISILVLILDFILLIFVYSSYKHYSAKLNEYLYVIGGIFILCILCLLNGIITLPLAIKKKKIERDESKNKKDNEESNHNKEEKL